MARITITARDDDTGESTVAGYFDPDKATCIREDATWNGSSWIGTSGIPRSFGGEYLWRTAGGRWVLERDAARYFGGGLSYHFRTDEQARDWLLVNGSEQEVARYFPDEPEERGPGRPQIGTEVALTVPDDLLERAADIAAERSTDGPRVTRSAVLREWLTAGAGAGTRLA